MPLLLALLLALSVCVVAYGAGQLKDSMKTALETRKLISIATRRANGEWGRAAPVWFLYDGQDIYFHTAPGSYKARRIRRGSPAQVWLDDTAGPAFTGQTHIVTDRPTLDRINVGYERKYWAAWLLYWARPVADRVQAGKIVAVRVTPQLDSP